MVLPLLSHFGSSRSCLLNGSFLSFYEVTLSLFSHVEPSILDFCLVREQVFCLTGTSAVPSAEGKQCKPSSRLVIAEPRHEILSCGVGQGRACGSKHSTGATGLSVLPGSEDVEKF